MTGFYSNIKQADRIRCRNEEAGNYLLYNPRTDELHMLDEHGKQVFDLCDGRLIDDVVDQAQKKAASTPGELMDFLCALKRRELVVMF